MNIYQQDHRESILTKFRRYNLPLTEKSMAKCLQFLTSTPGSFKSTLDLIVRKTSDIKFKSSQSVDESLKGAIQLIQQSFTNDKSYNNYEQVILDMRRRSIYYLSPYETSPQYFFVEQPVQEARLFDFSPQDKIRNYLGSYKAIVENNVKEMEKKSGFYQFIGVLYQNYSNVYDNSKPKIILQNEINQVQLIFTQEYSPQCILLSGCTYIAQGLYSTKQLSIIVKNIRLPLPLPQKKKSLLKDKFSVMCQNISSSKDKLSFSFSDYLKYDTIYNQTNSNSPLLIFGNTSLNPENVKRILKLISAYPTKIGAIVIMLSDNPTKNESIDLKVWFKDIKVYIVPHINSQGPKLLPKIPILKTDFNSKILTNPAKMSIQSKQLLLLNYPLIKNIYTKSLLQSTMKQLSQQQLSRKVTDLIFSQNTTSLAQQIYWRQYKYFQINSQSLVIVNDKVVPMFYHQIGKKSGLVSTGNFQRDGDFVCFMGRAKKVVQFCQEPKQ